MQARLRNRGGRRVVEEEEDEDIHNEDEDGGHHGAQTAEEILNDPGKSYESLTGYDKDRKLTKKEIAKLQKRAEKERMRDAMK